MLKRWKGGSLARILALASHSNPSKESLKNEERGVRELSFGFRRSSARKNGKRELTEEGEVVFIPLDPKIVVGRTATRRLRATLIFSAREQHPDTPGKGVRSIRPYTRSIRVRQDQSSCFALLSVFCGSQMFV